MSSKKTRTRKEIGTLEAAELLGVPRRTLQTMLKDGRIKGRAVTAGKKTLWFVPESEVVRIKKSRAKTARPAAAKPAKTKKAKASKK
jgi:excisionase family DNA binding protein